MPFSPSWLASFPRSGLTWVRFLVAHLQGGEVTSSAALAERVPVGLAPGPQGWACTDLPFEPHAARHGEPLGRLIHVVRHPADALLSAARLHGLRCADTIAAERGILDPERLERIVREDLESVLATGVAPSHQAHGIGDWATHTASWLVRRTAQPSLLVRYEDLRRDPVGEIHRLATFLGHRLDDDEAGELGERYAIRPMRRMQEQEVAAALRGAFYLGPEHARAYALGLRPVGRGRIGGAFELGARASRGFHQHFGPVMARLGYTIDPEAPVVPFGELMDPVSVAGPAGAA